MELVLPAEEVGFEPTRDLTAPNGFRDRPGNSTGSNQDQLLEGLGLPVASGRGDLLDGDRRRRVWRAPASPRKDSTSYGTRPRAAMSS
jgi:hypothetical protein